MSNEAGPYRENQKPTDTFRLIFKIHLKSGKALSYSRAEVESHLTQNVITEEMMKFFVLDDNGNPRRTRSDMVTLIVQSTEETVTAEYVDPQEIDHFETSKINERIERERSEAAHKEHIARIRSRAGFA